MRGGAAACGASGTYPGGGGTIRAGAARSCCARCFVAASAALMPSAGNAEIAITRSFDLMPKFHQLAVR